MILSEQRSTLVDEYRSPQDSLSLLRQRVKIERSLRVIILRDARGNVIAVDLHATLSTFPSDQIDLIAMIAHRVSLIKRVAKLSARIVNIYDNGSVSTDRQQGCLKQISRIRRAP